MTELAPQDATKSNMDHQNNGKENNNAFEYGEDDNDSNFVPVPESDNPDNPEDAKDSMQMTLMQSPSLLKLKLTRKSSKCSG